MASHFLHNWLEEKRSAFLYRLISDAESGTARQILFLELAQTAEQQAELWATELRKSGVTPPDSYQPDARTRLVARLIPWLGPRRLRHVLAAMKVRGMSLYNQIVLDHPMPTRLSDVGKRHASGAGSLRAAVFGVNDGLVSNTSLILGIAGATSSGHTILLTGFAGLLAGAFSMAAGEYVSVRSQREYFENQIALERAELEEYPQEEAEELSLIFAAKGLPREEARQLAQRIIANPDEALNTLAREELGLNPAELGSPLEAAVSSFVAFAIGAILPLLPFFWLTGQTALFTTVGLAALALFGAGAAISLFTGRHAVLGGLRMLGLGAAAGGLTYVLGSVFGQIA